jgi:hypothetical protein
VRAGETLDKRQQRVRYWGALALLRCVMSSPAAAIAALETRHETLAAGADETDFRSFTCESAEDRTDDEQPTSPVEATDATLVDTDRRRLRELGRLARALLHSPHDTKLTHSATLSPTCYVIVRLRRLLENRAAFTEHDDLWQSLRVLWQVLSNEKLAVFLQLAPLNGELFTPQHLDAFTLTNRDLLSAFWFLAWYQDSATSPPRRVNYAALDVEELGSVYESLLEFHPHLSPS